MLIEQLKVSVKVLPVITHLLALVVFRGLYPYLSFLSRSYQTVVVFDKTTVYFSVFQELFSLFDEDSGIRHNPFLTYIILGVWSLSVLQFTLTFATAHRPRRARGLRLSPEDDDSDHKHRR